MAQPNTSEKSNALDREENITRGNISAKQVALYTYDADSDTLIPGASSSSLTERYDYSSSSTIYTATAPVGTADDAEGWTIIKYDLSNSSDASGKVKTNGTWDDRATETYS
jgi:hypothetical protein